MSIVKVLVRVSLIGLVSVALAGLLVASGWLDKRDDGLTAPILIRREALAEAKKQNKHLLLWFSASYSDYCDLMEKFHTEAEVARVLGQYFVIKKVDVHEDFGGEQVYLEAGSVRGLPAFSLLDAQGNVLADSGQDEQNFGYPDTSEQLDAYRAVMQKACPQMTEEELQLLVDKLQEIREQSGQRQPHATPVPSAAPQACQTFLRTRTLFA